MSTRNPPSVGGIHSAFQREESRTELKRFGSIWLTWAPRGPHPCDWCARELTQGDVDAFVDFCMELGRVLDPRRKLPPPKVPCLECAAGAMSELVDGIPFAANARPSTQQDDPWSRPRWTPQEEQRERYP